MKLASIIIVWDDWELLHHAAHQMRKLVDQVIVIYSHQSNTGEVSVPPSGAVPGFALAYRFEPDLNKRPADNERAKRNFGIDKARELGFTHFILSDSDEFYDPEMFHVEQQRFHNDPTLEGLVCASKVYFRYPTLTIGLDTTLVPFIHKLTPDIKHVYNRRYPFAWEGGSIRIDPTRQLNITSGVKWSPIVMDHYSWVRVDYQKKIRNSTARANIERSTILKDLLQAKPGYFCEFYGKVLNTVSNRYNLPTYDVLALQNIQPISAAGSPKCGN